MDFISLITHIATFITKFLWLAVLIATVQAAYQYYKKKFPW